MLDYTTQDGVLHFVERPKVKHRLSRSRVYRRILDMVDPNADTVLTVVSSHVYDYAMVITHATLDGQAAWFVSPDSPDDMLLAGYAAFEDWFVEDYEALTAFLNDKPTTQPAIDQAEIESAAEGMALALLGIEVVEEEDTESDDTPFTYDAATLLRCWFDLHRRNLYPEKGGYLEQDEALLREVERFGRMVFRYKDAYDDEDGVPGMSVDVNKYTQNGTAVTELFPDG